MFFLFFLLIFVLTRTCWVSSSLVYQPRNVHLSYGENPINIIVTWSTDEDTEGSVVEYQVAGVIERADGNSTYFQDTNRWITTDEYVHSVILNKLLPGKQYEYRCGSNLGWSRFFKFTTLPNEPLQTPRLVIYGDMGADEPEALPYLKTEVQDGIYDAVLHLGDFAYELHSKNGKKFMELVESIAAYVPYMVCPGNHELYMNFKYYRNLFRMPGNFQGLWYSFNLGPAHFISISTEAYYFTYSGIQTVINQYNWLLKDLREATQPENRSKRPWIIIYGHRPMYCSNDNQDDCTRHKTYTRVGIPAYYSTQYGLEDLLNRFGVDLALWADVHSYERLWPVHDYVVFNGSYEKPYHNPGAPVHINVASAGASYIKGDFQKNTPHWSAFRSMDYGYMRMQIINKTHLYTEQVSVDGRHEIIDTMWLIKDKHGSYNKDADLSYRISHTKIILMVIFIITVSALCVMKKRIFVRHRIFKF